MKKPINTFKTTIILLMFFLFLGVGAIAQGPPSLPGSGGGDGLDVQDEAPITSLLIVGLIAGAAYGYKKLK